MKNYIINEEIIAKKSKPLDYVNIVKVNVLPLFNTIDKKIARNYNPSDKVHEWHPSVTDTISRKISYKT